MNKRAALLLLACVFTNSPASAEIFFNYYGLSMGDTNFKTPANVEYSLTSFTIRYGINFLPFLGIQIHANMSSLKGFTDPEVVSGAAFARLSLPTERTQLYILGGKARINYDLSPTLNGEDSEELAAGIGVELYGNEDTAIFFEAMRYGKLNELDSLNVGYVYRF